MTGKLPKSLLSRFMNELHRIATHYMRQERRAHTLQASALVNEAYLRLASPQMDYHDRAHFFAFAAQTMPECRIHEKFMLRERRYLQLRAEFLNLANHPQFDDPYVYPRNHPQAGKTTSASDYGYNPSERILQFGLKYNF